MESPAQLVDLQTIFHPSGNITVAESGKDFPFNVKRVYFLHSLTPDSERGAHGHVKLRQLMIAAAGSFRVTVSGKNGTEVFVLDDPTRGLLIPPMSWRDLDGFDSQAVCLVLASELYEESDYVRNYDDFLDLIREAPNPD